MTGGFYRLIAVYTLGFCLTNGSFGKVNASFVDTIKAGEPIATVLLTLIAMPDEKVTALVFLSLLPIVGGVATSSLSEASFNMLGFCMAMGSNVCFSARSICAKLLRSSLGKQMDNANLFVYINLYGAMALFPVALYFEGPLLLNVFRSGHLASTVKVRYATKEGTAKANSDYKPVEGVLKLSQMQKQTHSYYHINHLPEQNMSQGLLEPLH